MRLPQLSRLLTETLRAGVTPGAAIAMSDDGERIETSLGIANTSNSAPLSPDSRFQLGCITKLLTSLIALEVTNSGKLDLDEPIATYLPEMADLPSLQSTTSRHLLTHTSGYQGVNVADPLVRHYFGWPKFLDGLRTGARLFPPGSVFNYEHTECVMMGEILRRISGQHPHQLFRTRIFEPLGIQCGDLRADVTEQRFCVMDHAFDAGSSRYVTLRAVPYSRFWESSLSDLTISLTDLVTLGAAVAGFDERRIFSANTLEAVRRPYITLPRSLGGKLREQIPIAFGCGCAQYGGSVFGHNGSARGQTCALRFDLSSRRVIAVGLNCWRPHVRDMLCAKMTAAICGNEPDTANGAALNWSFGELAGRYVGALGTRVDVSESEAGLDICIRANSAQAVSRISLHRGHDSELGFVSDAPHLTVGFFKAPASSEPALMVGLNAFRREARGDQ